MGTQLAKMGGSGRLVIPVDIRRAMKLEPGDEVVLQLGPEGLLVSTAAQAIDRAQRYVGKLRQAGDDPLGDLLADRRREAEAER
jgi:bifunctional DNA-binding transcriptional regulator/antitoxin component of YhaV-PrlF toxin-antitoxin module